MGLFDNLKALSKKADEKIDQYGGMRTPEPLKYSTGEEVTPFSLLDQVTGAPTRTAVAEMQKGNFNSDVAKKALASMAQDPNLSPSGQDIARNMGVDTSTGMGKAIGTGYELALDPTNFIPSKGAIAGLAAIGKIEDASRAAKAMSPIVKESKFGNIIRTGLKEEPKTVGKVIKKFEPEAKALGNTIVESDEVNKDLEKIARDNFVNKIMPTVREKGLEKEFKLATQANDPEAMQKLTQAGIGRDVQKLMEDREIILKNRKALKR